VLVSNPTVYESNNVGFQLEYCDCVLNIYVLSKNEKPLPPRLKTNQWERRTGSETYEQQTERGKSESLGYITKQHWLADRVILSTLSTTQTHKLTVVTENGNFCCTSPKEEEEGRKEGLEIVMTVDAFVRIKFQVPKHLNLI